MVKNVDRKNKYSGGFMIRHMMLSVSIACSCMSLCAMETDGIGSSALKRKADAGWMQSEEKRVHTTKVGIVTSGGLVFHMDEAIALLSPAIVAQLQHAPLACFNIVSLEHLANISRLLRESIEKIGYDQTLKDINAFDAHAVERWAVEHARWIAFEVQDFDGFINALRALELPQLCALIDRVRAHRGWILWQWNFERFA